MKLSEKTRQEILDLQKKYPVKRSALIPALHLAQNETGYLPKEIQEEVATLFEITANEVQSIVTFYDMFFDHPVGKRIIHLCKGISCMLNGCDEIAAKLCNHLKVPPGGTTEDGETTVILSECLGACDKAPMALVDHEVIGPLPSDNLDPLLSEGKKPHG